MISWIEKHPKLSIVLTTLLMLGVAFPFLEVTIMEARNFITAREMLSDGNWLLTTMNGEPRYQKPPLPTWMAAISAALFGIKKIFALRLPGMIMAMVVGITFHEVALQLKLNKKHALASALILISSFYVLAIIIEAPWDIFTHGFMLLAILCYLRFFQKETTSWKLAFAAGLLFGCSILSKGPIGFYALFLPFLIAYGIAFKFNSIKAKLPALISSIIVAVLLGLWWYLYVRFADTETFVKITAKETSNWSSYNVRPFYYYWSFFTQSGIWTIPAFVALLYPYLKSRVYNLKVYKFALIWTLASVILLSIVPEKKSRYLMPVLIPLALNTSFYIEYLRSNFKTLKNKIELFPVYFNFGLIALIGFLFGIIGFLKFKMLFEDQPALFIMLSIILLFLSYCIVTNLMKKKFEIVFYSTIVFFTMLFALGAPMSQSLKGNAYKPIHKLQNELDTQNLILYGYNYVPPEMIWQYGDKIPSIKSTEKELKFPQEENFAMLANGISLEEQQVLKDRYIIEKKAVYDLNVSDSTSSSYRERLRSVLYILMER